MSSDLLVPAQVIGWIVRGAHGLNPEPADQGLSPVFLGREFCIAFLEYLPGRLRTQYLVYPEDPAKLKVRPVIERVPHQVRHGLGPFLEGLPRTVLSPGQVILGNPVRPHRTPLVMVSVMAVDQPELGDVAELDVLSDLLRNKMAMVIDDRHLLSAAVVKLPRSLRGQHEILVDKAGHIFSFLCYHLKCIQI